MRVLEAEVWCPKCHALYGRIFRVEVREGFYQHETDPHDIQKRCSACEVVLERK